MSQVRSARGAASRLQQESEGYKQRVIANAEGDASRFRQVLTEYAKAPQVTRERIYIDTMREILSSTNKIMMDYRGSGNLLPWTVDDELGLIAINYSSGTTGQPKGAMYGELLAQRLAEWQVRYPMPGCAESSSRIERRVTA